ncbi:hypothetical protein RIF29_21964 [Crotalaria pallida]|uniref:Uncharacterized protein n=1 Tax=Crotalaria pallida TaxID=3830 RepID=A0AAN9I8Y5_CROPI
MRIDTRTNYSVCLCSCVLLFLCACVLLLVCAFVPLCASVCFSFSPSPPSVPRPDPSLSPSCVPPSDLICLSLSVSRPFLRSASLCPSSLRSPLESRLSPPFDQIRSSFDPSRRRRRFSLSILPLIGRRRFSLSLLTLIRRRCLRTKQLVPGCLLLLLEGEGTLGFQVNKRA